MSSEQFIATMVSKADGIWGIFLGLEPSPQSEALLVKAISALDAGGRLSSFLATATSASSALTDYKAAIMSQLATAIRKRVGKKRIVDEMDEVLFSRFLPEPSPPCDEAISMPSDTMSALEPLLQSVRRNELLLRLINYKRSQRRGVSCLR